jgi:hypothetical protein
MVPAGAGVRSHLVAAALYLAWGARRRGELAALIGVLRPRSSSHCRRLARLNVMSTPTGPADLVVFSDYV